LICQPFNPLTGILVACELNFSGTDSLAAVQELKAITIAKRNL
jgi:hypothetical protein